VQNGRKVFSFQSAAIPSVHCVHTVHIVHRRSNRLPPVVDDAPAYDPLYVKGFEQFNACDFFEAHEVWEELWSDHQGPSRRFFQGLIQVAVCLHHFGNGNTRGAVKLYHSSRNYLEAYRPRHLGVDVDKLLEDLEGCCREIVHSSEDFPTTELDPERIPEIHLDPPAKES
jgi:hypothetical protein